MLKSACSCNRGICARQTSSGAPALPSGNRHRAYFRHRPPHHQRHHQNKPRKVLLPTRHQDRGLIIASHHSQDPNNGLHKLLPVRQQHGPPQAIQPAIRQDTQELEVIQVIAPPPRVHPTEHLRTLILQDKRDLIRQAHMSRRQKTKKNILKTKRHRRAAAHAARSPSSQFWC